MAEEEEKKNTETQRGEVTYPRSDSKSKKSYPRQGLIVLFYTFSCLCWLEPLGYGLELELV